MTSTPGAVDRLPVTFRAKQTLNNFAGLLVPPLIDPCQRGKEELLCHGGILRSMF